MASKVPQPEGGAGLLAARGIWPEDEAVPMLLCSPPHTMCLHPGHLVGTSAEVWSIWGRPGNVLPGAHTGPGLGGEPRGHPLLGGGDMGTGHLCCRNGEEA